MIIPPNGLGIETFGSPTVELKTLLSHRFETGPSTKGDFLFLIAIIFFGQSQNN
jgi:hypothetical protein